MYFALIHSPIVGALTWKLVAKVLESRGYRSVLPVLADEKGSNLPFWEQHALSAANAINELNLRDSCVLVGHSGAGPLLPIIGEHLKSPIAAYIFVDAGLPQALNRLEMIRAEIPEQSVELERYLKTGGLYPRWSDADLQSLIPNELYRQQLLKEIKPRGLPYFTETLPLPEDWDNLPCGYIQFSVGYAVPAQNAKAKGWPVIELKGGHFHMLVEPESVANALFELM